MAGVINCWSTAFNCIRERYCGMTMENKQPHPQLEYFLVMVGVADVVWYDEPLDGNKTHVVRIVAGSSEP